MLAEPDIELAGAAVGAVPAGHPAILGEDLAAGDEIVLVASSGLHANGASLARKVASQLADGYATKLGGATFGEALLEPSVMYVPLVAALLERDVPLSYLSHITGHGLLKLMRPDKSLRYRIERLPEVPPVLSYLVAQAGMDSQSAYSTFNMGAGFAVYCSPGAGARVVEIADGLGLEALLAGSVEEGPREVVLEPVGVRFGGERLELSVAQQ
jgi:phosphoribosylformylglycinamidine cyclo-ligase